MNESLSELLAQGAERASVTPAMSEVVEKLLIDVAGLCVAAREADYVQAVLKGWEASGGCTARTSTTPSKAARCMPAPSSCPRFSRSLNGKRFQVQLRFKP
jgi:hypothetical protein